MTNQRKNNAGFLTRRQLIHYLCLLVTRAPIPSQQWTNLFNRLFRHNLFLEKIQGGHVEIQLVFKVLGKSGNFQVWVALYLSLSGSKLVRDELN